LLLIPDGTVGSENGRIFLLKAPKSGKLQDVRICLESGKLQDVRISP
jgi:hypothetical protein